MSPSGLSYPAQTGSLTGQRRSDHLWDETEVHRQHETLPLPKLASLFPFGHRPQALSLTPDPLVTDIPLPPSHLFLIPYPPLLDSFSQKSGCAAGNNFSGSLLSYSIPKQAQRASFSLQRLTANSEAKQSGNDEITNHRKE